MKHKKVTKLIVVVLALCLCLGAAGCKQTASSSADASSASATASPQSDESAAPGSDEGTDPGNESESHYPVTVTTYNYACEPIQLTYEKAPEKIVSCNGQTTELILELGLADKVVGTAYLDNIVLPSIADDYAKTPILSDRYPSKEAVIGAGADFIIGWRTAFEEKALGDVTEWNAMGINTFIPRNANNTVPPNSIENFIQDVRDLGLIFDMEDKTDALIADFEKRLAEVETKIGDIDNTPRVLFVTPRETGEWWIHGNDRLVGDIINRAGGINIPEETVSAGSEDLINMDPDILFVVKALTSGVANTDEELIESITSMQAISDMRAIKEGKIVPVELSDFTVGGLTRTISAIEAYAKAMHPENFS